MRVHQLPFNQGNTRQIMYCIINPLWNNISAPTINGVNIVRMVLTILLIADMPTLILVETVANMDI